MTINLLNYSHMDYVYFTTITLDYSDLFTKGGTMTC